MYVYYNVHTYVHMCVACTILQMLTIIAHFYMLYHVDTHGHYAPTYV